MDLAASFDSNRLCFISLAFLALALPLVLYTFVCEYLRANGLCKEYLIQGEVQPDTSLVKKAKNHVAFSHCVTHIPMLWFAYDFLLYIGCDNLFTPMPPWTIIFRDFVVFLIACDTFLYWGHRTLHHKLFYTRFHKQHHEFKANIPVSSEYFTMVEEVVTGLIPTLLGPVLMRSHLMVIIFWLFVRVCESTDAHCGYDFPFSPFALGRPGDRHDFHHSHNIGNYSAFFCFWDQICGTDAAYKDYKKKQAAKAK